MPWLMTRFLMKDGATLDEAVILVVEIDFWSSYLLPLLSLYG
jgi:hypothetical protein